MKAYFLIPIVILTGCSSQHVVQMAPPIPGTTFSPDEMESVRYAETIKAYPIGRYVDPNDSDIMHEAHVIYRVETTAKWNLHPGGAGGGAFGPPLALVDSAHYNAPVNAEVIAEVDKQKLATQVLMEQGAKFNQSLSQLVGAFQTVQQVNEQNLELKQEMTITEKRLDALEDQLRNKPADSFGQNETTNNQW
ncbi:MAG TPA: hypothetical protein VH280_16910 [Verrucomicrobiae bacterium]|jgi:hypothetical protein|nr:hypothetical protein [Verrucomicrobiae bacterium]